MAGAKRRRRSRLAGFLCFRAVPESVVDEEEDCSIGSSTRTADLGLQEVAAESRDRRSRRKLRRDLARIFLSVTFMSSLRRKRSKESDGKSLRKSSTKSSDDDDRRTERMFSSSSTSSSSSSSSSSMDSSSPSSDRAPAPLPEAKPRRKRAISRAQSTKSVPAPARKAYPATAVLLGLMSLCFVVFCGKLFAILWTSTSLYLVLRRNTAAASPVAADKRAAVEPPDIKTKELDEYEKKRIILEGFLERNRKL